MKKYVAVAVVLTLLLVGCGKKEEPAAEVAVTPPSYTLDDTMAAMLRGHPRSKQICYDDGMSGWYLQYAIDEAVEFPFNGGWIFIQDVKFYRSSNKTWFISDQKITDYVRVYPDVAGLPCKTQ